MTLRRARRLSALFAAGAVPLVIAAAPAAAAPPSLDLRAAALVEAGTGQQLYALDANRELAIASATKLMTALVTLQHARLGEVFAAPAWHAASEDSQIGLEAGERASVHDLLTAMLLPSADDAAEDLAYNVGHHSVSRFVAMMNAQARRLGLIHTHYSTPIGLDTPGNYSSASDLVSLARYVLSTEPFFRRVVDLPRARIQIGDDTEVVSNLNTLIGSVPWVNGVKTGHTLDAGYVLVGSGTRDGMTLLSAVLGAPTEDERESETLALLQYGFATFRLRTPVSAGETAARPAVAGEAGHRAQLIAASAFTHVFARTARVRTVVQAPRLLTGPLPRGAIEGRVVVLADGVPVARIPLQLAQAVPAPPKSGLVARLGVGPFTLLLLALAAGAGIVLAMFRGGRIRATSAPGKRQG